MSGKSPSSCQPLKDIVFTDMTREGRGLLDETQSFRLQKIFTRRRHRQKRAAGISSAQIYFAMSAFNLALSGASIERSNRIRKSTQLQT
jgi:hypothetical protein